MIPNTDPTLRAVYVREGVKYSRAVLAWSNEGAALVVADGGNLHPASQLDGFRHLAGHLRAEGPAEAIHRVTFRERHAAAIAAHQAAGLDAELEALLATEREKEADQ